MERIHNQILVGHLHILNHQLFIGRIQPQITEDDRSCFVLKGIPQGIFPIQINQITTTYRQEGQVLSTTVEVGSITIVFDDAYTQTPNTCEYWTMEEIINTRAGYIAVGNFTHIPQQDILQVHEAVQQGVWKSNTEYQVFSVNAQEEESNTSIVAFPTLAKGWEITIYRYHPWNERENISLTYAVNIVLDAELSPEQP